MANKVKTHSEEVLQTIRTISTHLHAAFISKKMSMSYLSTKTGLSSNSLKTILKGDTANIASYIAVGLALDISIIPVIVKPPEAVTAPVGAIAKETPKEVFKVKGDGSPPKIFL